MNLQTVIATRRDGKRHTREEIAYLARAAGDGSAPDDQLAAWLMAAYINPLTDEETAWLTLDMAHSGERLDLTGLPKPWVDKHSTGGVGDKTSLVLLPLLASCGLTMVKMSGRGLGITGGTIDKLSSIPGFRVDLTPDEMKEQAKRIGLAITGATPSLAPADKRLYALRDSTTTVRSMPLIVSSILSKKIAGGAETVVLDVKCGSGAFMRDLDEARRLAELLMRTAELAGLKTKVAITDMDQPLGACVGNAVEVVEAISAISPAPTQDPVKLRFRNLCIELAGITLEAAGKAKTRDEGRRIASEALSSGRAGDKQHEWFEAQGVRWESLDVPSLAGLDPRSFTHQGASGWVKRVDARAVGEAVLDLGGGRKEKDDVVDLSVGVSMQVCVGSRVERGSPVFQVMARSLDAADRAARKIIEGIEIVSEPVEERPLILEVF